MPEKTALATDQSGSDTRPRLGRSLIQSVRIMQYVNQACRREVPLGAGNKGVSAPAARRGAHFVHAAVRRLPDILDLRIGRDGHGMISPAVPGEPSHPGIF